MEPISVGPERGQLGKGELVEGRSRGGWIQVEGATDLVSEARNAFEPDEVARSFRKRSDEPDEGVLTLARDDEIDGVVPKSRLGIGGDVGAAHDDASSCRRFDQPRDLEGLPMVGREEARDPDEIRRPLRESAGHLRGRRAETIIMMEGAERTLVGIRIERLEVGELARQRQRAAAVAVVEIKDLDGNLGKAIAERTREVREADGLEPHVGVVEVLDGRLDEEKLHFSRSSDGVSRKNNAS
jgi:hypothetical protein